MGEPKLFILAVVISLGIFFTSPCQAQGISGTYTGKSQDSGDLTLQITQSGNKVSGSFTSFGTVLQVTGTATNNQMSGIATLTNMPVRFFIHLKVEGAKAFLEVTEEGEDQKPDPATREKFELIRQGGLASTPASAPVAPALSGSSATPLQGNLLAAGNIPQVEHATPAASQAGAAPVSSQKAGWKTMRHPIGISVSYPTDWTVQTVAGGSYRLIPPDSAMESGQPAEAYFIMGAQAENISSPDNPQLLQLLESQVMQMAPFLQRTGSTQSIHAGTLPGVFLQWKGTNQIGKAISARLYVTIIKGAAICVFGLGYQDNLARRESLLRGIFTSFASGEASMDPQAAGFWVLRETRTMDASHAMQKTSSASETRASLLLQPNGQAQRKETYQMMANSTIKNSGGQQTSTIYLDSGPQTTIKNGRWMAGEGRLVLLYDNGTGDEYNYQVQGGLGGRQLILTTDKGRQEIWGESR
jgi:hypothetical protein